MDRARQGKTRASRGTRPVAAQRDEGGDIAGWVNRIFDHPVRRRGQCGNIAAAVSRMPPERAIHLLTRLFGDPMTYLEPFTSEQIAQGLWYLVDNSCSNWMFPLLGLEVPWEARRECIRAIPRLFSALFAQRCSDGLSHLGEASENPLNGVCYMWWNLLPTHGRATESAYANRDREFLGAMEQILSLRSMACQESALHGLGHWCLEYPLYAEAAIGRFLQEHSYLRPELRRYAENARIGHVL